MPRYPSTQPNILRRASRLRGDIVAWLVDEDDNIMPHEGAMFVGNQISATYRIPAMKKQFRVGWRSYGPSITAVCTLAGPEHAGQTSCTATYVMDAAMPASQFQSSQTPFNEPCGESEGWWSSPPAFESSSIRLEIYGATRIPSPDTIVYLSDDVVGRPAVTLRFDLVGLAPECSAPPPFIRSSCPSPELLTEAPITSHHKQGSDEATCHARKGTHQWLPARLRRKFGQRCARGKRCRF